MNLTNSEIQELKAKAHHLKPTIQIGKNGLTQEQIQTIKTHLDRHELIKIKFNDYKSQKEELSKKITEETDSEQIDLMGNTLILYKKKPNKTS
jgi:RNA-binding protein